MDKDLKSIDTLIDNLLGLTDSYAIPDDMDIGQAVNLLTRAQKVVNEEEASKLAKKKIGLEEKRLNFTVNEAAANAEIRKRELELREKELEDNKRSRKENLRFQLVTLGVTVIVPAIVSFVGLMVYKRQNDRALQMTLIDNGLPSSAYKDSSKNVNDYIMRNCSSIKM